MWLRTITALFCVLLGLPLYGQVMDSCDFATPQNVPAAKDARQAYKSAGVAYRQRKFRTAIQLLEEVAELSPDFPPAHYRLGKLYQQFRRPNDARQRFAVALSLCPDHPDLRYELGIYSYEEAYQNADSFSVASCLELLTPLLDREPYMDSADYARVELMHTRCRLLAHPLPFDPQKLPGVSSEDGEYLPLLTTDQELLYFTKRYQDKMAAYAKTVEKFYVSRHLQGDTFSAGDPLPRPFNTGQNQGGAAITPDNKEVYMVICDHPEGPGKCDITYSRKQRGGEWSAFTFLSAPINTEFWESQVSISSDGKTLYFISDRPEGLGMADIYYVQKDSDGVWGNPVNMGAPVNTSGEEQTPYIHPDNKTFYFSSDGHPGMGGLDIFVTRRQPDGSWSSPQNIGYPINDPRDNSGFFVRTDGRRGYFDAKVEGNWDIYFFDIPEEIRPMQVLLLKGAIKNEAGEPVPDARLTLRNTSTGKATAIEVDSTTGEYVHVQTMDTADYMLTAETQDHFYQSQHIASDDEQFDGPAKVDFEMGKVDRGAIFEIDNILFATNSHTLNAVGCDELDNLVRFMQQHPTVRIAIHGHTDNVGNAKANRTLSQNRAHAVYQYLVNNGISSGRLSYKGFGQSKPVASNATEAGRASNRRTEVVILHK